MNFLHPERGYHPIGEHHHKRHSDIYHIFIRTDQIFYDVDAQIAIVTAARRNENGEDSESLTGPTEKMRPLFERWIDKYIGLAKATMQAFLAGDHQHSHLNAISKREEIDITIRMPEYWQPQLLPQLTNAIHDYIVNSVLYEFFTLHFTSKDPLTQDKETLATQAYFNIKGLANAAQPGIVHKHLDPF